MESVYKCHFQLKCVIPVKTGIQCFQRLMDYPVKSDADLCEESLRPEDDET